MKNSFQGLKVIDNCDPTDQDQGVDFMGRDKKCPSSVLVVSVFENVASGSDVTASFQDWALSAKLTVSARKDVSVET